MKTLWRFALIAVLSLAATPGEAMIEFNVMEYGARADGETDDNDAIQDALDAAAEKGGTVYLPPGRYRIDDSLNIPPGVTLQGAWTSPHHGLWDKNTTLYSTGSHGSEDGPALIEMNPSTAVRGLCIYYPNQDPNNIVPYPWAIHGQGMHCTVENVTFINAYNGISIGPEWNELHLIRNVFGTVLRRGVQIDNTTDIGRLENVHFNLHYWHRAQHPGGPSSEGPEAPYRQWMQENLEAFIFGRTDWESVTNTFVYGCHTGYKFVDFGRGQMNGSLLGVGADGCIYGLWVDRIQPMGLAITNGQFAPFRHPAMPKKDDDPPISAIRTTENFDGNLSLVNCVFWGGNAIAHLRGGDNARVRFTDCHFSDWNVYDSNTPAMDVNGPALMVRGSTFSNEGRDIVIGEETKAAIITDNFVKKELHLEKPDGLNLTLTGNIEQQ